MAYRRINYEITRKFAKDIFISYGYSDEDAEIIVDVLLKADLMGIESHGVQRLTLYPYGISKGRVVVDAVPETVYETPLSAVLDAHDGAGQIVSVKAMNMAISKAQEKGFGFVTVRNSNHYGIAGYYSLMAAEKGLIGISMTNTQALVVPTFGKRRLLGTNPIAVTVPANPTPFHLDMSTSVVTAGKMEVYAKNNKKLPAPWLVDESGAASTDANHFVEYRGKSHFGGLLPLGGEGEMQSGYKGYGLSMVVEIMTGILAGGVTSAGVRVVPEKELCCHMFAAIDPKLFNADPQIIFDQLSEYLQMIRASEKADGCDRIYIHGEKEFENIEKVKNEGVLMSDATYDEICKLALERGMDISNFC